MQRIRLYFFSLFLFTTNFLFAQFTILQGLPGTIDNSLTTNYYTLTATGLTNTHVIDGTCMNINHPDLANLSISLIAPDGTTALLTENQVSGTTFTNTCFKKGSMNNIANANSPYTGPYQAIGDINAMNNGQDLNGTWQLAISFSNTVTTTGTVDTWEIGFFQTGSGNTCTSTTPTHADVDYVGNGNSKQFLDVYVPSGITSAAPTVMYIHGGEFQSGAKGAAMTYCEGLFCDEEYVIIDINYRLSGDSLFPALIYDTKTAIRFIKENAATYMIDTCRIGLVGTSAGAHIASFIGTSMGETQYEGLHLGSISATSDVHAVCHFYGSSDFTQMDAYYDAACATPLAHEGVGTPESLLLGCDLGINCTEVKVQAANPITYINGNEPPFYLHHGTIDCSVPMHQSSILYDTLVLLGIDATYDTYTGGGHGDFVTAAVLDSMETFFIDKLTGTVCNYSFGNCQTNLYVPAIPGSNTFSAIDTLSSDAVIQNMDEVIFHAGTVICLNDGFEVKLGGELLIEIDSCGTITAPPPTNVFAAGTTNLIIPQVIEGILEDRPVYVKTPDVIDPNLVYRLLFFFHGSGGNASNYLNNTNLNTIINNEDVIGIYPQGFNNVWNLGPEASEADEIEFLDLIMTELATYSNVDLTKVYAMGSSNGGAIINQFARERAYFNAIAPQVSQLNVNQALITPPRDIAVYQVNGDSDGLIPINGGSSAVGQTFLSAQASAEDWATEYSCNLTPIATTDNWGGFPVNSYSYETCNSNVVIQYHVVVGAGHGLMGAADPGFTQRMWDFLKLY